MNRSLSRDAFRAINNVALPLIRAGIGSPLPLGLGLVVLETTGRKSGLAREVPVVGLRVGDRITVSTVRADSQWLANLEANSAAAVWRNGRRRAVVADVVRGPLNTVTLRPAV